MKDGNTVEFTATLKEKNHLEWGFDSNDNLHDICHFIDNTCARLQELKSSAIIKAIGAAADTLDGGDIPPKIFLEIPRQEFEVLDRSVETLREPAGDNYVRCLITLKSDKNVSIEYRVKLNGKTSFNHAAAILQNNIIAKEFNILADLKKKQQEINQAISASESGEQWNYFMTSDDVSLMESAATAGIVARAKIKLKSDPETTLYFTYYAVPFTDFMIDNFLTVIKTYDEKIKEHFKNKEYFMEVGYGHE